MKHFFSTLALIVLSTLAFAQNTDSNSTISKKYSDSNRYSNTDKGKVYAFFDGGCYFSSKMSDIYSVMKFNPSFDYTIGFGFKYTSTKEIELSYTGANPAAIYFWDDNSNIRYGCHVHYFLLGYSEQIAEFYSIRPFYSVGLGASYLTLKQQSGYNPLEEEPNTSKTWSFAAAIGAGLKYDITDSFGIKLQGRLLVPMSFTGLGISIVNLRPYVTFGSYSFSFNGDVSLGAYYNF
ncbi:MAG: hypothetical protein J6W04_03140 [Bacteroidales bacterium]|nr:hypothetical protein [Bacteroidales bacterium]